MMKLCQSIWERSGRISNSVFGLGGVAPKPTFLCLFWFQVDCGVKLAHP